MSEESGQEEEKEEAQESPSVSVVVDAHGVIVRPQPIGED
jgi:hypothetical protein